MSDGRLRKFVETSGVPRRLAEVDLASLDWGENGEVVGRVLAIGERLASGEELDLALALVGSFGVGKTLVATYLIRRAWEFWAPRSTSGLDFPRFFRISDLTDLRFRSLSSVEDEEEDRRAEAREALARAPLVAVDDVHRVAGYRGEEVFLESVVERRYDDRLATVLTANRLPDDDSRFADFLRYFRVFPLVGESHRGR